MKEKSNVEENKFRIVSIKYKKKNSAQKYKIKFV